MLRAALDAHAPAGMSRTAYVGAGIGDRAVKKKRRPQAALKRGGENPGGRDIGTPGAPSYLTTCRACLLLVLKAAVSPFR